MIPTLIILLPLVALLLRAVIEAAPDGRVPVCAVVTAIYACLVGIGFAAGWLARCGI